MAILLSEHLQVSSQALKDAGVFDAVIGADTKLFVDPTLLSQTNIPEFKDSRARIVNYFGKIVTLLQFGENIRTKKIAVKSLTFPEPDGVSIGYSSDSEDGLGIGPEKAERLFQSALEIFNMGITDPEIIEIVGIFEEGFGPDLISDMTLNIIRDDFFRYTQRLCNELNISTQYVFDEFLLPQHPFKDEYLLFLPIEFLRALPVAANWEDIFVVAQHNHVLREKVNSLLKGAFNKKKKPTKKDFRNMLWGNRTNMQSVVDIYKSYQTQPYDFNIDPSGWGSWYQTGQDIYRRGGEYTIVKKPETKEELLTAGQELANRFKRAVEENGSNKLLFGLKQGELKPYREEVAQLIFYAVADGYCRDRNIFLSRESNSGPGPVDFSFGTSYDGKILFELKKSSNDIISGYTEQLAAYEKSEAACGAFYLILRMTDKSPKIDEVLRIEEEKKKNGQSAPSVVVIDARLKEPASKRKRK